MALATPGTELCAALLMPLSDGCSQDGAQGAEGHERWCRRRHIEKTRDLRLKRRGV